MHPRESRPRIYLDNAATSWPKPPRVYDAVDHFQRQLGAPAGRGAYAEAVEVAALVESSRRRIATLLGLRDPTHLIFTANGTDSLNLVIHGLLQLGDHVVTTVIEHNSVLRPLAELEADRQITVSHVGCDAQGLIDPGEIRKAIGPATRLVAVSQASNVTGAIQPIAEIGQIARSAGVLSLCDAAQAVGHMDVNLETLGVDFLAASGHKGLMGPLGTGVLAIRADAASRLRSVRQGGTGTRSEQTRQPQELPQKFESGNLNVPGIVGMGAGAEFIAQSGLAAIESHGHELTSQLLELLRDIEGLRIVGPTSARQRVPLVSFVVKDYDPQEVAAALDAAYRVQVRAGLHCAPAMHKAMATDQLGGTVRVSLGCFTTSEDVATAALAIREVSLALL